MLWPVERGEEVPVGCSYWCFLQDRGRIFVFQREGRFLFWAYPPQSLVKGGECPDMWRDRRWGFFLTSVALWWAGRLAAHACVLHPQQSEQTQSGGLIRGCMMCTLPSEGVSFCLSTAAKSLLNKKADVKVSPLVSSLTFRVLFLTSPLTDLYYWRSCAVNLSPKIRRIEQDVIVVLNWSLLVLVLKPIVLKVTAYSWDFIATAIYITH